MFLSIFNDKGVNMKIHEYQAKSLLNQYNIRIPKGYIAHSKLEAMKVVENMGFPCVIKAQVHAGGRGKAGGIKFATNKQEANEFINNIINTRLVTFQSGSEGQPVDTLLIEEPSSIKNELYLGVVLDREFNKVCLIASLEGGMDIEVIAEKSPEKIIKTWIDPFIGIKSYHIGNMYSKLGLPMSLYKEFSNTVMGLYKIFTENDVSLIEINPLAVSGENTIIALDAKIVFDDNALFRLGNIMSFLDQKQENPREIAAQKHNLSYIALEGEIGCLVNGAGLAMSTMDIIKHVGGSPANFLDVGGSATEDNVKEALKIILNDDKVKSILINVFGGIAKCDVVAAGIINAAKEINITVPLIVRLEGTNVEKGQKLLNDSNLKIIPAFDLLDAAQKAVKHIENQ